MTTPELAPHRDEPEALEEPPARLPWEEPPPGGWTSTLQVLGLDLLQFLASVAVVAAVVRIVSVARRMDAHPAGRTGAAAAIALWGAACLLGAAVLVYVWRRLGGLAVVGAMLTDTGRLQRLGGRPPVWLDGPPEGALRIAHLSDLHLTEGPRVRLVERAAPGGNAALDRLLDHPALDDAELVLFTGDITDRGTAVAWRCFLDLLEERGLAERAILVPGNHDIALVDAVDRTRALRRDRFGLVQLANLLKFSEAFAATYGGKRGFVLVGKEPVPFVEAFEAVERDVRPLVATLSGEPVPPLTLRHYRSQRKAFFAYERRIEAARERLLGLYPVAIPIAGKPAVLYVLNSCASVSRHPATNAIGHVGRAQYRRLERLGKLFAAPLSMVAVHHHVVRRGEELSAPWLTRVLAKFTVLGDARPLVRFCRGLGVRAVLNGHRHLSYQLRLPNGTVLCAAPSSTLGDELARDLRPQFERYDFAPATDPRTVGIFRSVVRIPRAPS